MSDIYLSDVVLAARFGVHRTTVWRWANVDPSFPRPISLSPGCTRWKLSDVVDWKQSKQNRP